MFLLRKPAINFAEFLLNYCIVDELYLLTYLVGIKYMYKSKLYCTSHYRSKVPNPVCFLAPTDQIITI